jgi:DNA-binding response OmpR family regulator
VLLRATYSSGVFWRREVMQEPVVAIINHDMETLAVLRELLEEDGFHVEIGCLRHFIEGRDDLGTFLARYDPEVVIFDVSHPIELSWTLFRVTQESADGRRRKFIVTTTVPQVLAGQTDLPASLEILHKPFSLEELRQHVCRLLSPSSRAQVEVCEEKGA